MNEDFERCKECEHAYFIPETVVLIAKGSDYDFPILHDEKTVYKCAKCGHKQYEEG
jgi:DNA-directed RNA polymerase subunit RPC12/RpoP